jgi:hypothetical protein
MDMNKKGEALPPFVWAILWAIIGLVVIAYLVGALAPTLITSFTQINNSGLPLASLFDPKSGVALTIFVIMLFVGVVILVSKMSAHGRE